MSARDTTRPLEGIAIIGMAGRFPGASSVADFWRNQLQGIESISHFEVNELEVPSAAEVSRDPAYVRARGILAGVDEFDPEFFGIYPREAELMDPQQRLFLECCWQAFEDAGYEPTAFPGSIGVYAGCSTSTYFLSRLCSAPGFIESFTSAYQVGNYPEMMGNNLDFLATRVAYKLNLRGPAFTIQAGCSTSLLAVTQACQSLLTYQSDMALAGGSSITFPQKRGSHYQEGGMVSPDGHCRTFDAEAQGTVFGSGVAVVLLKRYEDAVRDGDQIYAVIRGFAANNDGSAKVGYTAPGIEGQARVIALAQAAAGVSSETIGYVEAHGTGTPLGDPIELAALAQAFGSRGGRKNFCVVGTAKTNVGHLDIAAGVTGLIHASHIVRHGVFPPTLHFQKPNPKFDLENSPFYVNSKLAKWNTDKSPRRAGVSAFGVGGTNAHVILEQGPESPTTPSSKPVHLLPLSARSETALDHATKNLAEHLKENPDIDLANVAWTLQAGRRAFQVRRTIVARDAGEAIEALTKRDRQRARTRLSQIDDPQVCFLFPGQGSQHLNMAREIYQSEPVFRTIVDECAQILQPLLGVDLRMLLYPSDSASDEDRRRVTDTIIAQPAIFTIEYALAQLWMSWGIRPKAMLGHSIGEFVAACISGVFSLEDAIAIVAERGRMMQEIPAGAMLSVRLPESELRSRMNGKLSLAAVNAQALCVVAGPFEAMEAFEARLNADGVACRRLTTSHAFHSAMMDPLVEPFTKAVARFRLNPLRIPYVSGVTGKWITENEATDPAYWARHFREPVQFSLGITELRKNASNIYLEVGPGNVLSTLSREHTGASQDPVIVSSLTDGYSGEGDAATLISALGSLWLAGIQPDWKAVHGGERRLRVSLPTYPFERKRYWVDSPVGGPPAGDSKTLPTQSDTLKFLEDSEQVSPNNQLASPPASVKNRAPEIRRMLAEIFEDLSGKAVSAADSSTTFLELGFDSLFLTQVTQALQAKFGLKITFRQLLGEQSTLDDLAAYIDGKLPASAFAAPPAAPAVSMAGTSAAGAVLGGVNQDAGSSESAVERLMREQLQAMNQLFAQQLAALKGQSFAPATSPGGTPLSLGPARDAGSTAGQSAGFEADKSAKELKGYAAFKPLPKGPSGELTPRQREHIRALIERYTKRTAGSKQKTQEYRGVLADPRVVAGFRAEWKEMIYPIITVRSEGSKLWDVDGNEYIDILNGFGPIMLGHRPDFVQQAIDRQLREGFEIGPQTLLAGEVARMICEFTGNERATFCNTGSEAVIAAMRVARTVTGRNKVVFFAGDYHGMFDEVLMKGFTRGGAPHSVPAAPGIPRESASNVTVLEYGAGESLDWIRANASSLAAVMVEPVQSRHPSLQPVQFLKELRKITQEAGTCLIFDEVVTGFRVHPGGCQALFDIRADLATYGKVLAGGMPIGVLAGKRQFMDALDGGMWQFGDDSYPEVGVTFFAGTFVRHPLALAAAKAVLEHLKQQGPELQENLSRRTGELARRVNEIIEKNGVPTRIENFASIFYFSFPSDFRLGGLFYYHLRAKGIHVLEGFPCFLTTSHTDADMDRIVHAFEETIEEMRSGDALPQPSSEMVQPETAGEPIFARSSASSVIPADIEAPLTESQLEVWLSDQISEEASCSYNESFTLHLRGRLDEEVLRKAIHQVMDRHDALRTRFDSEGKTQHFASNMQLDIPLVDLTNIGQQERHARLHKLIDEQARLPFKLEQGPLVRAQLARIATQYHRLVFTSHHIVCDGWSTNVLLDEIAQFYNALKKGAACDLPAALSFATYARSQKDFFESPVGQDNERFWVEQFREPALPLDLPTDRIRPAMKEFKGSTYRRKIDAQTLSSIKKFGARQKCTLFVTLLAGLQILLSRLSGQEDVVVGVPSAGQPLVEDKVLVGHCVNFLPLRARTAGDLSTASFLAQVRQTLFAAYEHQNYTYGRLVRKLDLQRDPGRLPLTEIQFNLERVGEGLQFDGLEAEVDPNPKAFVNFDIFLNVVETKDGLILDCDYNTGLYDETTIARWLGHYETLLDSMISSPDCTISRLALLTESETRRLTQHWNDTALAFPRNLTVHKLIERQVRDTPDSIAVVFEDSQLTYAELDRKSNQIARYLRKLEVKPGLRVGVFVERGLEMIVALLGTMKAGGAYVPLDPTFPPERLRLVLEDARASVVLTQEHLTKAWSFADARVVRLDSDWAAIEKESGHSLEELAAAEDVAYVLYTSGSTGKPKGVEVPHRAVVNLLQAMLLRPGLKKGDTFAAITTLSFDISGLELYLPLCTGARLVIVSRETGSFGVQLLACLKKVNATVMQATPVTWRLLIEAGWDGNPPLKVLCGGEVFPRELADQLAKRSISVWNMYGPTETTIWSATGEIESGNGPVPIGQPIANTQFYVLDKELQLSPIGIPGELYIAGDGVAHGYLNQPDLTASKFVPNPFSKVPGARMYKTGDSVVRRPRGDLAFLGRADDQIKLRGFRIELGEIQSALVTHPGIKEAVVILRQDVPGEERLVAYIILDRSVQRPEATDLRTLLLAKLPDYMVPAAFVVLDGFPLTPNGKIDRRALPAPDWSGQSRATQYVAPRTPEEQKMAQIWAEVLRLDEVGINDNLFELGADSLHVFQIAARANKANIPVTPRHILQFRSIGSILSEVSKSAGLKVEAPAITPVSREKYRVLRKDSRPVETKR